MHCVFQLSSALLVVSNTLISPIEPDPLNNDIEDHYYNDIRLSILEKRGLMEQKFKMVIGIISELLICGLKSLISANVRFFRTVSDSFKGTLAIAPRSQGCSVDGSNHTICPGFIVLADDILGPSQPNIDHNDDRLQFIAWNKTNMYSYLSFQLTSASLMTAIDLYFLNYPNQNISLPNLRLYRTSDLSVTTASEMAEVIFDIWNNRELSDDDHTIRRVSLLPRTPFMSLVVLLRWTFTEVYNVDWFLLSEVRFCTDSQPTVPSSRVIFQTPITETQILVVGYETLISKSLILTCTVSNEGSIEWHWSRGSDMMLNSSKFTILSADATRTSKLTARELNELDDEIYTCEATFDNAILPERRSYDVQLPTITRVFPSINVILGGPTVALKCEVLGYSRNSTLPMPSWTTSSGADFSNISKYFITIHDGDNTLIYPNGTTGPSIVLTLFIYHPNFADEGNYTCSNERNQSTTELTISTDPSPTLTIDSIYFCARFSNTNCTACTQRLHSMASQNATIFECYWCEETKACGVITFEGFTIPFEKINCPQFKFNFRTCGIHIFGVIIFVSVLCGSFSIVGLICICFWFFTCTRMRDKELSNIDRREAEANDFFTRLNRDVF